MKKNVFVIGKQRENGSINSDLECYLLDLKSKGYNIYITLHDENISLEKILDDQEKMKICDQVCILYAIDDIDHFYLGMAYAMNKEIKIICEECSRANNYPNILKNTRLNKIKKRNKDIARDLSIARKEANKSNLKFGHNIESAKEVELPRLSAEEQGWPYEQERKVDPDSLCKKRGINNG